MIALKPSKTTVNDSYKVYDSTSDSTDNSDIFELRNTEGKNFKEKVRNKFKILKISKKNFIIHLLKACEVLNPQEKKMLKRYLLDYKQIK